MSQEYLMSISIMGFGSLITMMIYNHRKNSDLIRNLCERLAKLEGMLEARFKWVEEL